MRSRLSRSFAVLATALAFALFAVATARAKGADIPVRIDYRASPGCGQESTFVARLVARVPRVRAPASGEVAPQMLVRVSRAGRGVHGRLSIQDVDGAESSREVDGDTCESVERALVLVAALALDPSSVAAAGGPASTSTSQTDGGAIGDDAQAESVDAAPGVAPVKDEAGPRKRPIDVRTGWHLGIGGGVLMTSGSGPDLVLGVPAFLDLARNAEGSVWSPSFRLGFEYENSGNQDVPGGGVRLVASLGTVDVCPLRLLAGPVRFSPCVRGEAGALDATGVGINPSRSDTRPWVTLGALARARYVPASPFFVELLGGGRAALQRDRFFFEPDQTVFRPPLLSGFLSATVGVTIL